MKVALCIAGEAKRVEEPGLVATDRLGDQLAHTNHLVAMVGVGDDEAVLPHAIKYRKAVRGECADAARGFLF